MGRSFLFAGITLICVLFLLFLPLALKIVAHYDMNRKKFCFSIYLFSIIKLFGGYVATYPGGFAVHISKKKALLLPYNQVNNERKRFSFMNTFRLHSFVLMTETGAEYLLPMTLAQAGSRLYFFIKGGKKTKIENNIWLLDGDVLRISCAIVMRFTMFIIIKNIFLYCKEKVKKIWQKKMKKSTV
jgi:hypothetical protein